MRDYALYFSSSFCCREINLPFRLSYFDVIILKKYYGIQTKNAAAHSKNTFAETIHTVARSFSLFTVFDDFLTMSIAVCTQNLETKKSWYEDEYLTTIVKYKDSELRHEFPKAFAFLIAEMEEETGLSSYH